MQEALAHCEVGVQETLSVDITPITVEGVLVARVDAVQYKEPAAATPTSKSKAYKPKPAPAEMA